MERPLSHEKIGALVEQAAAGRIVRQAGISLEEILLAVRLHHALICGQSDSVPGGSAIKRSDKSNVTLLSMPGPTGVRRWCVREFVRDPILRFVPMRLRHRPALRSWVASERLKQLGVGAAEAMAVALGKGNRSYLVMRAIEDAEPLGKYVRRLFGAVCPPPDDLFSDGRRRAASALAAPEKCRARRAFLEAAADCFARLYRHGVYHTDLKAGNILVRELGTRWEFILLDLAAVQFRRRITLKEKTLNLAQLNASLPLALTWRDRRRFLRMLSAHEPALETRAAMKEVARLTRGRRTAWHD